MLGILSTEEIDALMGRNVNGRIGYTVIYRIRIKEKAGRYEKN